MNRKTFTLALFIIGVLALLLPYGARSQSEVWARVLELEGDLWIEGQPARVGSKARLGDEIKTGRNSQAVLKLRDKSVFMLRSNTTIVLKEAEEVSVIRILLGRAMGVFSPGERRVETPTAVAGVRGTGLYTMVEGKDQTYFCVCFGTIEFEAKADPSVKRTVTADHHSAIRVKQGNGQAVIVAAGMEDHTDDEVEHLVELLDQPFSRWRWWE